MKEIDCSEWIGDSQWIKITVDCQMPIGDVNRGRDNRPTSSFSDSSENSTDESSNEENPLEDDCYEQDVSDSDKFSNKEGSSPKHKRGILIGQDNMEKKRHTIGVTTNKNAIKITVNNPNVRFLQIVTRYNINEDRKYNHFLKASQDEFDRLYYSSEEEIKAVDNINKKKTKEGYQNNYLNNLNWKVDCLSRLPKESYGKDSESPYYDQPEDLHHSGAFKIEGAEKSLYDEPELWDLKTTGPDSNNNNNNNFRPPVSLLCKDVARFFTFIVAAEDKKVLGFVEWARIGRPYISNPDGTKVKWRYVNREHSKEFQDNPDHTYCCDYKVFYVEQYDVPRELPLWVSAILKKDATGRNFDVKMEKNKLGMGEGKQICDKKDAEEKQDLVTGKSRRPYTIDDPLRTALAPPRSRTVLEMQKIETPDPSHNNETSKPRSYKN